MSNRVKDVITVLFVAAVFALAWHGLTVLGDINQSPPCSGIEKGSRP